MTEEKQVRVDWHQTSSVVCISIFAKVAIPDKTVIKANHVKCQVSALYEGGTKLYQKTFTLREVSNIANTIYPSDIYNLRRVLV